MTGAATSAFLHLPPRGGGRHMRACLHVSGEGGASQKSFFNILFCLHRFIGVALKLPAEQAGVMRRNPLSRSQRNCAAINLPHEGGGEERGGRPDATALPFQGEGVRGRLT